MNLYQVILRGMQSGYGESYVVADNPSEAYNLVKKFVDENDLGFYKDRELLTIKLLAGTYQYNDTGMMLHLPEELMERRNGKN